MEQTIQSYNKIFWKLVSDYDLNESNIFRKMIHSFDVAKNCFELACSEKLNRNQMFQKKGRVMFKPENK